MFANSTIAALVVGALLLIAHLVYRRFRPIRRLTLGIAIGILRCLGSGSVFAGTDPNAWTLMLGAVLLFTAMLDSRGVAFLLHDREQERMRAWNREQARMRARYSDDTNDR